MATSTVKERGMGLLQRQDLSDIVSVLSVKALGKLWLWFFF